MQICETINASGCSLWTTHQGKGPALVCCHGGPGLWDYLAPVAEMVDDLATVYRYDQRACGRSTGEPSYGVATAVADLEALRVHWNLPQWIILGHSWGATLALAYCLAHPSRASALIYLSGTGIDASWKVEYHRNQGALLTPFEQQELTDLRAQLSVAQGAEFDAVERAYCELSWSTDIADRSRPRELARQLFVDGLHINFQVNRVLGKDGDRFTQQPTMADQVAASPIPTMIIQGACDPRPARVAQHLAQCMPSANYVELPDVGHLPWIERPSLLRNVLRPFLQRLS
ncbi:alpha/beta fold hydrolase [Ktedonobacter racemifer]|uniref:Alpha/beta hydrolase fold protein n=1 Tax=Ktedonobacter racemifer DSM 44963 TaxID=485913 RepID=D6U5K6_KTERA|nr:alpha/beta fold hydrolase [Ktedonobacter racemifer]EFH80267.1 alpha/beta hydrolase fold protein [Ktedonobacter racemifer DSM 44963]